MRRILILILGFLLGWSGSLLLSSKSPQHTTTPTASQSLIGKRITYQPGSQWLQHASNQELSVAERLLAISRGSTKPHEAIATLQRLQSATNDIFRREALSALFGEWLQRDPQEALAHCLEFQDANFREAAIRVLAEEWGKIDIDAAINGIRALPGSLSGRHDALRQLAATLSKTSPSRATELLDAEDIHHGRDVQEIYNALAEESLEEALDRATKSKSAYAMRGVMSAWLQQDFMSSIAELKDRPGLGTGTMKSIITANLSSIVADNPITAIELISSGLDPNVWGNLRQPFMAEWVKNDSDAAIDWVTNLTDHKERDASAVALATALSKEAPQTGIDLLQDMGIHYGIDTITRDWANLDWEKALIMTRNLTLQPEAQAAAAAGMLQSTQHPINASDIRELLSITEAQDHPPHLSIDHALAPLPPEEVKALLEDYPNSLGASMAPYLNNLVARDPQGAATVAEAIPVDHFEKFEPTQSMLVTLANNDLVAAGAWLSNLPEGSAKTLAYENYANAFTRTDPAKARAWLETPPNDLREASARIFAKISAPTDPQEALAVALSIEDPNLIGEAMAYWHHRDPEGATQALTDFEPKLRSAVEKRLELNDQWRALGNPR